MAAATGAEKNPPRTCRWEDFRYFKAFVEENYIRFEKGEKSVDRCAAREIDPLVGGRPKVPTYEPPQPDKKTLSRQDPL